MNVWSEARGATRAAVPRGFIVQSYGKIRNIVGKFIKKYLNRNIDAINAY